MDQIKACRGLQAILLKHVMSHFQQQLRGHAVLPLPLPFAVRDVLLLAGGGAANTEPVSFIPVCYFLYLC